MDGSLINPGTPPPPSVFLVDYFWWIIYWNTTLKVNEMHDEMYVIWVLESLECFVSLIWFDIISYQHLLPFVAWHDFAVPAAGCWPRPSWHLDSWSNWGWRTVLFCVGNDSSPSKLRWNLKMIPLKRKIIWWNLHFWVPSYFSGVYMYRKIPSRELTYPPKNGILKMIFLFPPEGHHVYNLLEICTHVIPCHTDCVSFAHVYCPLYHKLVHIYKNLLELHATFTIHNVYIILILCV